MQFTLALDSSYLQSGNQAERKLINTLNRSLFDRCQLTVKSSQGKDWLRDNDSRQFRNCIEIIHKNGIGLVASVAAFEDKSNNNTDTCVYEAGLPHSKIQKHRICPGNRAHRETLANYILQVTEKNDFPAANIVHLSYFRYENFNQCVCKTCLDGFNVHCHARGKHFHYNNYRSLLSRDIVQDWVNWRADVMASSLNEYSRILSKKISIEIDFDESKRYMAGPHIEEGLSLPLLLQYLDEIYLHIEPLKSNTDFEFTQRSNQRRSYLNHLRYLISLCAANSVRCHFFCWFLSKKEQIKTNLRNYLMLARAAKPNGLVLYTMSPVVLADHLEKEWS